MSGQVQVQYGSGTTEDVVRALERRVETVFPDDYRAFLLRFGHLSVHGSADYGMGALEVFGIVDLVKHHEAYRALASFTRAPPGWLDGEVPEGVAPADVDETRARIKTELGLGEEHVTRVFGDRYDLLRIAHRFMVPVMAVPDEFDHAAECIGPGKKMYTVSVKDFRIEPPRGTFTTRFLDALERVVVR